MSIVANEDQASGAAGGHQEKKATPRTCECGRRSVFCHSDCLHSTAPFFNTPVSAPMSMTVLLTSHHWYLSPHQPPCNLSCSRKQTMDRYINNLLSAGLIRLSSSLLGAGFFFVEKKDKTCRPCIDYQGLNEMTIKNKYLLPLIDLSFEPLCHSKYFTKLDLPFALRSFCDCISPGDEWKTAFNTALRHLPSCFPSTYQQHSLGYA